MSVAIPASAQVSETARQRELQDLARVKVEVAAAAALAAREQAQSQTKPEVVVARLMSFDQNHDGRVTRAELPERMQTLLMRADASKDESLDAEEVLRLAQRPPIVVTAQRGFEPGHYGFGEDNDFFDSRLHIDSAIEDLRLASSTREKALGIGHAFADTVKTHAMAEFLTSAEAVLTPEQFTSFKAAIERDPVVTIKTNNPAAEEALRAALINQLRRRLMTTQIEQLRLGDVEKRQMQAALEQFKAHDRLIDSERAALLGQLGALLTDQERDDLRAALERRPIIKQGALPGLSAVTVDAKVTAAKVVAF
jgi:hypothetical protein